MGRREKVVSFDLVSCFGVRDGLDLLLLDKHHRLELVLLGVCDRFLASNGIPKTLVVSLFHAIWVTTDLEEKCVKRRPQQSNRNRIVPIPQPQSDQGTSTPRIALKCHTSKSRTQSSQRLSHRNKHSTLFSFEM